MEEKNGIPNSLIHMTSENLVPYENLILLPYLYDNLVVDCVIARYAANYIYTWAGPILVAVNPIHKLKYYYSRKKVFAVRESLKDGSDYQEPHIYTVAGIACSRLLCEVGLVNQAILVSGESGSGKTESAKYILKYLTEIERGEVSYTEQESPEKCITPHAIQNQILASNPILEAFGNSSTLRNHNSSRFGKFIRLLYKGQCLKGALIETYLLEKTRVTSQIRKERNFHIFYQLLAAVRNGLVIKDLNLDCGNSFNIVPQCENSNPSVDFNYFKDTLQALSEIVSLPGEEEQIFKVVAAIMHLGNVQFQTLDEGNTWTVSKDSHQAINDSAILMGLSAKCLEDVFTKRKIVVTTSGQTTVFDKPCETEEQCSTRRDSLMQLLYSRLFTYLVSAFNAKIGCSLNNFEGFSSIGILDIYGFEAFEHNSLEQLCINYTNERLQQEFTRRFITMENKIMLEEGFLEVPFEYTDNALCVSALDSKLSVFGILNEECQLRRRLNENGACSRLCSALESSGVVSPIPRGRQSGFLVKHYAGQVAYQSTGLLQKNKDEVSDDILQLLYTSTSQFISYLRDPESDSNLSDVKTPTLKKQRKNTTLSKFKGSLDTLVKSLASCDLHYVRCIKPNLKCISTEPNRSFLMDQLSTNGILETVKISQFGYPVRMLYNDFVTRYGIAYPKNSLIYSNSDLSNKEICLNVLCKMFKWDSTEKTPDALYKIGNSRVFLSEKALHELEQMRKCQRNEAAVVIQKHFRRFYLARKYENFKFSTVLLQRKIRSWLCRNRFLKMSRSAIIIQKYIKGYLARKQLKKLRYSTIVLQKYTRGWLCRKKYVVLLQNSSIHQDNSVRPFSRNSQSQSGYGSSVISSSITDCSASDVDQDNISATLSWSLTRQRVPLSGGRELHETEESGIETDTESLSGETHKMGRLCRFKPRNDHSSFRTYSLKASDDDVSEFVHKTGNRNFATARLRDFSSSTKKINSETSLDLVNGNELDHRKSFDLPIKVHKTLGKAACSEPSSLQLKYAKKMGSSEGIDHFLNEIFLRTGLRMFYKDGVISYRRVYSGKVVFHTRVTCLPFSTSLPIYAKSQGLVDSLV